MKNLTNKSMRYLLTLQDDESFIGTNIAILMAKWGKRKSESTLKMTREDGNYLAVPCSMIKDLTPIK